MKRFMILLLILVFALAACGGDDDGGDDPEPTDVDTTSEVDSEPTETEEEEEPTEEPEEEFSVEVPEGYSTRALLFEPLVDINTGETFTLASFAGRPILLQGMTVSCAQCPDSHDIIRDEIIPELGTEDFVFISFDPVVADRVERLQELSEENNYDWIFVLSDTTFNLSLSRLARFLTNGSAQPRFYIGPNGEITEPETGTIDAEAAIEQMRSLAELANGDEVEATEEVEMTEEATEEAEMTEEATEAVEMTEEAEATEEMTEEPEDDGEEATEEPEDEESDS